MDIRTIANFIKKCFELGIPSSDCSDLLTIIEPDFAKHIGGLRLWISENDES
jgi:hypothetical protein